MSTRVKFTVGLLASLVASATFAGAAFAAPSTTTPSEPNGYGMMRSLGSGTFDSAAVAEMYTLMRRYRAGSIADVERMHADGRRNRVMPLRMSGISRGRSASRASVGRSQLRSYPAMMNGASGGRSAAFGMMGSSD